MSQHRPPLTADELGEVGESLFRKLCAQAQLTCNKADRDRTGWDFRVEFPMAQRLGETLDQRSPRVCQIQLKSTAGESGTRVMARLSSIERLAKDTGPAAIVVFRMKPDGKELMGYVVHLLGDNLAKVLHRLRQAEAAGRRDINHMTISFDYRQGRRFKPDVDGLRAALAEISPIDVEEYSAIKREQLATLGYAEGGGIEADALIWLEGPDHLTKILSGEAPLRPLKLRAYDRRFGIRVPYQGSLLEGVDEFPIGLPPAGPCSIVIRAGPLRPAALFRCEAFIPLPVEGGPILVIRHPTLNIVLRDAGLHIESAGNFRADRHSLPDWIVLLRGLTYLAEGSASLELEFHGARITAFPAPEGLDGPYIEDLPRLLDFVERWERALELAGVPAEQPFDLENIWAAGAAQMSLDLIFNPASLVRLEFDAIEGITDEQRLEALYFNVFNFAETAISFATKVTLERQAQAEPRYASASFELLDIRPGVSDLSSYGADIAERNGISIVIDPGNITTIDRSIDTDAGQSSPR